MSLLKEQLLKAGLVTEDQVKASEEAERKAKEARRQQRQAVQNKPKAKRQKGKPNGNGKGKQPSANQAQIDDTRYRPAKNPQRAAKPGTAARKAQLNAIKFLIKKHRANTEAADQDFNFVSSNKIRKVRVTSAQAKALASGKQVLLRNPQDSFDYVILPIPVALEIAETEKHAILVWNGAEGDKYWADEEAAKLANRAAHEASASQADHQVAEPAPEQSSQADEAVVANEATTTTSTTAPVNPLEVADDSTNQADESAGSEVADPLADGLGDKLDQEQAS